MNAKPLLIALLAASLGGCANDLSGLGGKTTYSCSAPPGVSCMSVSGIHANATKGTLPALRDRKPEEVPASDGRDPKEGARDAAGAVQVAYSGSGQPVGEGKVSPRAFDAPYSGQPIRTPPRVLRVWMAPYEDADRDLHDQRYLYVTVHTGRWVVEANQLNIAQQYRQVHPLGKRDDTADPEGRQGPRVSEGVPQFGQAPQAAQAEKR